MAEISFLNGEYVNLNEAKISVLDRGFLFGDGIYEVIPVYGGHMFRLQRHFKRLQRSLSAIGLPGPYAESEWLEILEELIRRNKAEDVGIYLQITRGVAHRDHAFPQEVHPTVFAMVNPIKPMSSVVAERGVAAIALPDNRWARCDIKSISLLGNVLLRQQAVEQEAVEAILLRDGEVTEGAASNVFIVHKGIVKTPPKSDHLLPGVTRDLIVDLLSDSDLVCEEASIPERVICARPMRSG